ncbi:phage major capsid protein [Intestinibacillus massiliensis]
MAGIIFSEGSGLTDSLYGKSQAPIKALIEQNVEAFQEKSMIDKVFYMDTTKNYAEKYTSETSIGDFEDVGENGAYPKTTMQEGYSKTIEPTTWKSSFEVTQEMLEDAKMGKIKSRANIFGTSYNRTREKFAADMLAGGVAAKTSIGGREYDTTTADGAALFSAAHPSIIKGAKGAQSNLFSYSTGKAFTDVLDAAQERMQDFRDDDGNLLNVSPSTLLIPNVGSLKRALFAAIGSDLDPNTANHAMNFQMGLWNVLIWPYLPKAIGGKPYFYIIDEQFNSDYMCLPWLDRVQLTVRSDIDPNTDANIWKGRARFGAGFNNWRSIALVGEGVTGGTTLL